MPTWEGGTLEKGEEAPTQPQAVRGPPEVLHPGIVRTHKTENERI